MGESGIMNSQAHIAQFPNLPPLRGWQRDGLVAARQILLTEGKPHLYASAPTGSGKSRYMFEVGEQLPVDGLRIIVVGMNSVVNQHRESFVEMGCVAVGDDDEAVDFDTPTGRRFRITTWQSLARSAGRGDYLGPVGILFFDECHVGGSGQDATSIPLIIEAFQPEKKVYVSATTQTANESLLGVKAGHFYRYSYADAFEDGILNPVDLLEVHTGINARIALIEGATGKNVEDLQELEEDNLHALSERFADLGVDIEGSMNEIVGGRHDAMILLYLERHVGQQAIFFSPNIDAAEKAVGRFNSRVRRMVANGKIKSQPLAQVCHSKVSNSEDLIAQFRSGGTKVIFVVGMLQEGFDLPTLDLAFDCRFYRTWSPSRVARLIQKIGRLMRRSPGKGTSQYYYARDISDYYQNDKPCWPAEPEIVEPTDEEIATGAGVAAAALMVGAELESEAPREQYAQECEVNPTEIEQVDIDEFEQELGTTKVTIARTPLYVLHSSRGHTVVNRWNVAKLFGSVNAQNKAELLALPVGSPRPNSSSTKIGAGLSQYTSKKKPTQYDPEFDKQIRAKHPDWFAKSPEANKAELLALPVGSPRPHGRLTKIGAAFAAYTSPASRTYDPEFDKQIRAKHPDWFSLLSDRYKAELLALPVGSPRPSSGSTKIGAGLSQYTNRKKTRVYDPEFDKQIRAKHPDWFVKSSDVNKAELLALPVGTARPSKKSKLGMVLLRYLSKNGGTYDPVFESKIRAKHPAWFKSIQPADVAKAELLALPVGAITSKRLRESFTRYTEPTSSEYDSMFYAKIREKQPAWFVKSSDAKKAELLALPVNSPKPKPKTTLYRALSNYVGQKSGSHDPVFAAQIREKQPAWFKS